MTGSPPRVDRIPGPRARAAAAFALLAIYAYHARAHIAAGQPPQLLWACNVGLGFVAIGWIVPAPRLLATGFIWLAIGTPMWVYGAITEFGFHPSSVLAHGGGLGLGALGVARLGLPRGTWWRAALAVLPLVAAARLFTPPEQNINLAHAIFPGWESVFSSHLLFLLSFYAVYVLVLYGLERLARRLGVPEGRPGESPGTGA